MALNNQQLLICHKTQPNQFKQVHLQIKGYHMSLNISTLSISPNKKISFANYMRRSLHSDSWYKVAPLSHKNINTNKNWAKEDRLMDSFWKKYTCLA